MSKIVSSIINTGDLKWGTSVKNEQYSFPEWAEFLFEVGYWLGGLGDTGGRLFCTILLPSRVFASALVALGALSRSLQNSSNGMPWETFLELESGTHVYFLYNIPKKGKRQLEGKLGEVISYGNESLRKIHIEAKKKEHKNLTISLSKSHYEEANVSRHPQHRTVLLNDLSDVADVYRYFLPSFNENRLLLSQEECLIVTNKAAWKREVEDLFIFSSITPEHSYLFSDLLMLKYGRVQLCSPRSREINYFNTDLSILDGIDPLRSKDNISSSNSLIILEKNEYQEEAEDLIYSLSDYCDRDEPLDTIEPAFTCPDGIEIQLYFFSGSA